jgi:hypothetical protein
MRVLRWLQGLVNPMRYRRNGKHPTESELELDDARQVLARSHQRADDALERIAAQHPHWLEKALRPPVIDRPTHHPDAGHIS